VLPSTRLLVLGAVRAMQPIHGYELRRELMTWRLEDLANLKPGSIYGALRTLEKEGCIEVANRESAGNRPERTEYVLTSEGHKEFHLMLREAWWSVHAATEPLIPPLTLLPFMSRDELVRALQARIGRLEDMIAAQGFLRAQIRDGATGADGEIPEHVREIVDFTVAKTKGELDWARAFQRRLRDGAYTFEGEPGFPGSGPGGLG